MVRPSADTTLMDDSEDMDIHTKNAHSAFTDIQHYLDENLVHKGFEAHPLLIGWYNEKVGSQFQLNFEPSTLAFIIISVPSLFEKSFLPFIARSKCDGLLDPIDACIRAEIAEIKSGMPQFDIQVLHDYEMDHCRRPRVLVQTAGHVSGAAYYYRRDDVTNTSWSDTKPIYGVSVHPRYGGWFALRCVTVFANVRCPDLPRRQPTDVLQNVQKIDILEKFNDRWQDNSYRDVIHAVERYSPKQQQYFATLPKDRRQLLTQWLQEDDHGGV